MGGHIFKGTKIGRKREGERLYLCPAPAVNSPGEVPSALQGVTLRGGGTKWG